jgi:CheY-like chemotaxis protein
MDAMISVLVVDDDSVFRELAVRMLSDAGLPVVGEADSVESARALAAELRPDAALVDVMLADGDGVALAHELADLPWRPQVLLTSTSPDAVSEKQIASDGVVGFVPKESLPSAPLRRLLGGE